MKKRKRIQNNNRLINQVEENIKNIKMYIGNLIKTTLKGKSTTIEEIYIDEEEELAFAKLVDDWERYVWPLERTKEQEQEQKECEANHNDIYGGQV